MNFYLKRVPYTFYFFIVVYLLFLLNYFEFPDSLDIGRYYLNAEDSAKMYDNIWLFIKHTFEVNNDFVYMTTLFVAVKLGIPLNFITILYLSLYYICICEMLRHLNTFTKVPNIVLLYILMCAPLIWVMEISRNLAAIAFLYLSIFRFINGCKKSALLFLIMSVMTHISMIVYLPLMLCAVYLSKTNFIPNKKIVTSFFIILIIIGVFIPNTIVNVMVMLTESSDSRYAYYSEMDNIIPLRTSLIGYGDKIPIIYIFIYSIYIVINNSKHDFYYWMLFLLTGVLSFAIFSSLMLTNRIIMLMPMFIGVNVCSLLKYHQKSLFILSLGGALCVMAHFYSYRTNFCF